MKLTLAGKDWERFNGCLHRLVNFDFTGLHKEVGEYVLDATKERFRKGVAPDGTGWKQSRRAKESGGKTMMDTRRLYNSLTYRASIESVEVGTNVKYAKVHQPEDPNQDETVITPKKAKVLKFKISGRWVSKKEVRIPRRDILGINDDDVAEINQIGLERIKETVEK
jgi:phage gpG-like protein